MIFSNAGKNDLFPIIHEYFFFYFSREKYNNRNEISTLHALKTQKKDILIIKTGKEQIQYDSVAKKLLATRWRCGA